MWDVGNPFDVTAASLITKTAGWHACKDTITSIDFVDSMQLLDTFIVIACVNGDVTLWTLSGGQVGMFGQRVPWTLDVFSTYKSLAPPPTTPPPPVDYAVRGRRRSGEVVYRTVTTQWSLIPGDRSSQMQHKRKSAASLMGQELHAEQIQASPSAWRARAKVREGHAQC